jgi:hypothetical protein
VTNTIREGSLQFLCSTSKSRSWQNPHLVTNKIRSGLAALLFLGCLVTLTSAFNLPNTSRDLSSRLASFSTAGKPAQQRTTLTLADRLAYQRAIDEVYWRHRIWPTENSKPKPSLDEVMSAQQIEKKVENYLRDSQALEDYWQKPIAPEQLQAEMERMARHTKQPEVLRELFEALGNDPSVIAECLARPVLAERLVADLSAHDKGQRFALLRTQAAGSKFSITTSGKTAYAVPEIDPCTDDTWTPTSVINAPAGRIRHAAVWTGSEMIIWGGSDGISFFNTGGRYNPSTDSWTATSTTNAPSGREFHTAVWTGSEMVVWGGYNLSSFFNTGGRYNPNTDSWTATTIANAPVARYDHTAVWSGSEMIVWGGVDSSNQFNTGGRYNPSTDSWTATSTTNAPSGRELHTAVWTGSEMIIWGGTNGISYFNTGGRYCAQGPVVPQSAFSRKTHGAAGTFDIPLPLTGNVGIECRSGGATNNYQMIVNFATTVTVGGAAVTSGTGSMSSFNVSGSQVTVNLTGVTNVQRITVTLFNVNDGTHMSNVPVSMGVLVGDVNGNAVVNASDVSLTKSQVGQVVSSSNFREDVNANGLINSVDVALVKAKVGTALPP